MKGPEGDFFSRLIASSDTVPAKSRPAEAKVHEGLAAHDEVDVYSVLMHGLPMLLTGHEAEWKEGDPKKLINDMLARIPESVPVLSREEAKDTEMLRTKNEPSELETYLLYKILITKPDAFHFSESAEDDERFSPSESMKCLRDGLRTKRFLHAIRGAIESCESSGTEISVLDAGAGALPIMGMYAALTSPSVRVVCLENNTRSAALARAAIQSLGLTDRIELVVEDARTYVPEKPIDVLVSETMNTGLLDEPLTEILGHLAPYVRTRGSILPSKVEIMATSVPLAEFIEAKEYVHIYGEPCPKLEANWQKTGEYVPGLPLPRIVGTIPGSDAGEERVVLVASKVSLGTESLDLYESLISMPEALGSLSHGHFKPETYETRSGNPLRISYAPGAHTNEIQVLEIRN